MGNAECRQVPAKLAVKLQDTCDAADDLTSRSTSRSFGSTHRICAPPPSDADAREKQPHVASDNCERRAPQQWVKVTPSFGERRPTPRLQHQARLQDSAPQGPSELAVVCAEVACCKKSALERVVSLGGGPPQLSLEELQRKVSGLLEAALWSGRLDSELSRLRSEKEEMESWEGTPEDDDPADQPTVLLQQLKALPTRACRKEERWPDPALEAIDDDLESNLETTLQTNLMAAASAIEEECLALEKRCWDQVGVWYEEATIAVEDKCATLV